MGKTTNTSNIKENLGYLGVDFQIELVKCFIEHKEFFIEIEGIVDQNMFTDDNLRRIVGFMKDRYNKAETVANYEQLETITRATVTDKISVDRCCAMIDTIKRTQFKRGIDLVEGYSERFFKQQNLTKAINQALDIIRIGDSERYDNIEELVRKALVANNKKDFGYRIFDNMEDALKENYRDAIPTGAVELDGVLNGGLAKGELGIIIAPSSVGKTSATTGFAATAAVTKSPSNNNKGYKVLHIHFEDKPVDIKRKYYAFLTGIDAQDLSKPDIRPHVIEFLSKDGLEFRQMIQENVIAWNPQSGEISATDIKMKLRQLIANGFQPDLVVIDYFECLKLERRDSSSVDSEWSLEGIAMRKLEAIAHEFNVAVWCPVQGTKDSFNQEIVGMSQAGGSVKKVQIGHVIISFARTDGMRTVGTINIFINKFRGGKIDKSEFLGVMFNNGTCRFDFSTVDRLPDSPFNPTMPIEYTQEIAKKKRDESRR